MFTNTFFRSNLVNNDPSNYTLPVYFVTVPDAGDWEVLSLWLTFEFRIGWAIEVAGGDRFNTITSKSFVGVDGSKITNNVRNFRFKGSRIVRDTFARGQLDAFLALFDPDELPFYYSESSGGIGQIKNKNGSLLGVNSPGLPLYTDLGLVLVDSNTALYGYDSALMELVPRSSWYPVGSAIGYFADSLDIVPVAGPNSFTATRAQYWDEQDQISLDPAWGVVAIHFGSPLQSSPSDPVTDPIPLYLMDLEFYLEDVSKSQNLNNYNYFLRDNFEYFSIFATPETVDRIYIVDFPGTLTRPKNTYQQYQPAIYTFNCKAVLSTGQEVLVTGLAEWVTRQPDGVEVFQTPIKGQATFDDAGWYSMACLFMGHHVSFDVKIEGGTPINSLDDIGGVVGDFIDLVSGLF